ncbi:MAG: hypothetical protein QTN59_14015 [Candidatus Electrothrix communis]|nr:MAG: hypothetical protein QTN59_14015 [Candidatus Electrothrix communis]
MSERPENLNTSSSHPDQVSQDTLAERDTENQTRDFTSTDETPANVAAAPSQSEATEISLSDNSTQEEEGSPDSSAPPLNLVQEPAGSVHSRQTTTTDSLNYQINIGGNVSSFSVPSDSQESSQADSSFTDPTSPLPDKPAKLPNFEATHELQEKLKKLKEERVLVVNCPDEDTLLSAGYSVAEHTEVNAKRSLTFEGNNADRSDLCLDTFINGKIGNEAQLVILVTLKARSFLDSMFVSKMHAQLVKQGLCEAGIFLILLGNLDFFQEVSVQQKEPLRFPQWEIDFLPHLLKQHFSAREADYLERKIREQRQCGLWDENNNDSEFYELISGCLHKGTDQFREETEERSKYVSQENRIEFFRRNKPIKPHKLILDGEYLNNTVIYTATYFPGLSTLDFDNIVSLLLRDKKTAITVESEVVGKDGDIKNVKSTIEKELIKIWQENPDKIMRDCRLHTIRKENGSMVIDFNIPYLRRECKAYFEEAYPIYLRQLFARIQQAGLLFNFKASPELVENIIVLSADMAVTDPTYYGKDWLVGVVIGLKEHFNIDFEPDDEFEQFLQFFARIEAEEVRRKFFARLSELIREMLNYQQLLEIVRNFLNDLIGKSHHDVALEIVLELTRRLQFAPQFDHLYWIKRFLDQGAEGTRNKAYLALINIAKQRGVRIYDFLEEINEWLPEPERDFNKYSLSNQYALAFLINYCLAVKFNIEHYGKWPSKFPLFTRMQGNNMETEEKLNLLFKWLFHPGMKFIYHNVNYIIADLLEQWVTILYGFDKENEQTMAVELAEMLIKKFLSSADQVQRREIVKRWKIKFGLYFEEMKKHSEKMVEANKKLLLKKQLMRRRAIVYELIKNVQSMN